MATLPLPFIAMLVAPHEQLLESEAIGASAFDHGVAGCGFAPFPGRGCPLGSGVAIGIVKRLGFHNGPLLTPARDMAISAKDNSNTESKGVLASDALHSDHFCI